MEIQIFKTNINSLEEFYKIKSGLNKINNVLKMTIDLEDVDKVLRVEAINLKTNKIVQAVRKYNFYCEEMED